MRQETPGCLAEHRCGPRCWSFDWARDLRRTRSEVERLFVLVAFGDVIGLPILPPYYTLRLLPYVVPALDRWRRNLLRERDWTDLTELIEGID